MNKKRIILAVIHEKMRHTISSIIKAITSQHLFCNEYFVILLEGNRDFIDYTITICLIYNNKIL